MYPQEDHLNNIYEMYLPTHWQFSLESIWHYLFLQYQYRDRAKELRDKYGRSEAIIPAWKKKIDKELSEDGPVP